MRPAPDDPAAGFSTLEMLAAFVVLSLGLGLAVQSIQLSSTSLRRADDSIAEQLLVKRLVSEELPRLLRGYAGKPAAAAGDLWRMRLTPLSQADPKGPVEAVIWVAPKPGAVFREAYVTVLPLPPNLLQPPVEQPPANVEL